MGATHLPSTEFDAADVDEQREASAETVLGGPGVDMVQLLDVDGKLGTDEVFSSYAQRLDPEKLRGFYADMATIRRFDQEATALQRQGQLALWVPLTGQEAAQIGSGRATQPQDYIFPTYREHGVALTRNVDLAELLRQFRGVSNGGWDPKETNFHLYTLVLAAQTLHAVGYAMGIQRDQQLADAIGADPAAATDPADPQDRAAVVAYFGDGASSEGDVHESMVFAASYKAPVVFFCQNNHWAISVPTSVQTRIPLANRALGYGFPGIRVDGNDVIAVHAVTEWALEHARSGNGPVLIEAFTYRVGAHTTADDPTKYRESAEETLWRAKDPLERLEKHLRAEGYADDAFFEQVKADGDELAAYVRRTAYDLKSPDIRASFANVYADAHPLVAEELAWFEQYSAGFADAGEAEDASEDAR
ncbi:pyruvate dehydrogenase (acetyl-transferring) E1 component subunit alpha [Pseudarthrobacter sp. J75]|uniref:pyruvate dehydrogenase (acetyl-transferring) E1 component subunit alpha n=1 Tax=unclassified Pseudarthrobacter TaxID=2647000 RepID=UPI002E803A06|nr:MULTISPECIES: pyruvate dehydrogenase (acetyl-transferring) E1 component subunit alpha [unclassified Pseudarthrobacter]MEE2523661.1 pyruvate dehydrogenase (acetyl-transferring) E1 component subunit alpha [Pseudarthrobacter sp. J47]MEE2530052.1 pyruvate dehydrogenase (acetyl-transferring) E1 component subunit alpha [Pseudarthrobacter sp. J75]